MRLISHFRLSQSQYLSEWLLDNALISAHWQPMAGIHSLTLKPAADCLSLHTTTCRLSTGATAELCGIYGQALVALAHCLSLDDALQEAVITERMALEQQMLKQMTWRDNRPCVDTSIPLKQPTA